MRVCDICKKPRPEKEFVFSYTKCRGCLCKYKKPKPKQLSKYEERQKYDSDVLEIMEGNDKASMTREEAIKLARAADFGYTQDYKWDE